MTCKLTRHLMFDGVAEEAMNFYVSLFEGSKIVNVERCGPGEQGADGTVKMACSFSVCGNSSASIV
jgi:predicted 3-demethylubiquinone-9 3-methyltransferase (glyoxalase superfamily)